MIRHHFLPVSALLVVAFAITIGAQPRSARPTTTQPAAMPAPTPAPSAPATVNLPNGRMAVIYTESFLDPQTGIAKFNLALTKLNDEFKKTKDDLTAMQTRSQALETEINKLREAPEGTPIDQRSLQAKIDQLDQLKKDGQRKSEDAQAAYNKRRAEIFNPLQEELGRALETFAKAHGINVIIDAGQVPLLYIADSIDITRAFIADFNSKNPATASASPAP
jgi:Skp family chaperone for outer membrane proteins